MPVFIAELPETHLRITRPIVKQVMNDVLSRFKDMPFREFRYSGDVEDALLTPGSAIDSSQFNRALGDTFIDVTVEDLADESFSRSRPVGTEQWNKIVSCKKTQVDIFPLYMHRKLVINFKIQASTRVRLNGLITRLKAAMDRDQITFAHLVSYNYEFPVSVETLLQRVYILMQSNKPYDGLTYEKWFAESIVGENIAISTNLNGVGRCHMVQENNVNVLSFVSDPTDPRKSREGDAGIYSVTIPIETYYQRPTEMRASYPVMVHNQLMGDIWYNRYDGAYDFKSHMAAAPHTWSAVEMFRYNLTYSHPGLGDVGVKEPIYDDWGVDSQNPYLRKIVTALVAVDEGTPRVIFHPTDDLHDYIFPKGVVGMMNASPKGLINEGKHPFHVKFYANNTLVAPEHLYIDDNGNLCVDYDLCPRTIYHVVYFLNISPGTVPTEVWDEIRCCTDGLRNYFGLFGDTYTDMMDMYLPNIEPCENGCICLTLAMIDNIINKVVEDNQELVNDPSRVHRWFSLTKLHYAVVGKRHA